MDPRWLLGAAMVAAATLIWIETAGQTFHTDEFARLYARPGVSFNSLFIPEQGNLVAGTVLLTKIYTAVFGTDRTVLRLILIGLNLACSALLYEWIRRRVGDWYALLPASLMLVFGAGAELLVGTNGIAGLLPVVAGLGAMLLLERGDVRGDGFACALLTAGLACYSSGIAFVAVAALIVTFRGAPDRWRCAWVWAVPVLLLVAWKAWVEITDPPLLSYPLPDAFSLSNIHLVPRYVLDSLGAACAALTGLFPVTDTYLAPQSKAAIPLALLLGAAVIWRIARDPRRAKDLATVGLPPLALWTLIALSYVPLLREPNNQRYVFVGALFVLFILAELFRGAELTPRRFGVLALVWMVALVPNVRKLHKEAVELAGYSEIDRSKLTAIDLAGDRGIRSYRPEGPEQPIPGDIAGPLTPVLSVGGYLDGSAAWGSIAFSPEELQRQSGLARRLADEVLVRALGLRLDPAPAPAPSRPGPAPSTLLATGGTSATDRGCLELRPRTAPATFSLSLPASGISLMPAPGAATVVAVGRFSDGTPVPLFPVPSSTSRLVLGADASPLPWRATVVTNAPVRVCGLPAEAGGG